MENQNSMATENDFIVFNSAKGKPYTKRASLDIGDGEELFRGSHKACMDFLDKITKASTRDQINKLLAGLTEGERKEVEAFILELKARGSSGA